MSSEELRDLVFDALEDLKARDIVVLDLRGLTPIADYMVVATGRSDRHVKSLADNVLERCRQAGVRPMGVEGQRLGSWVLVDLQDVIVHVMLPQVREFYDLEKLWDTGSNRVTPGQASGVG